MADFEVQNHGSVFLLRPTTIAGKEWVRDFIPEDAPRWGHAVVVEHRFISDLVEGIAADGLEVTQ